jgi:hypothetical protein
MTFDLRAHHKYPLRRLSCGGEIMSFLDKLFGKATEKETKQMSNVKLAVIYYSSTGTNYKMAQVAADAA